ncbi:hypothetical protein SODALDRAFT_300717 [Sodiomyces alkalinus F11]|uniref:Thioredoxin-like fold domain-containing protein n=1 Tax=Sodiomyces alkalinus (strain CBS 110278 / VKM F-3762 / F11) TaxID=1314773 RepID=A0A3N2PLC2_SODAK|nr:hypothetical protein SODALDRAFT_300717 [Sodiomyces alkalinus F11]ROT35322.1 hypothetical protein SODALDRAFT_300717 [Sodiomyces alkalinus F11]
MPDSRAPPAPTRLLAVPGPIAALFNRVPLAVYPPNDLPLRSPSSETHRDTPILYVFTTPDGARTGAPSFNPSCLKWQTVLKIARLPFSTAPSTNHASPTGALPFLLPPPSAIPSNNLPIPSGDTLFNHVLAHAPSPVPRSLAEPLSTRQEAYLSLLDARLRPAFLYSLYLTPANTPVLSALYVDPTSSAFFVRATLLRQVRHAAESEILKTTRRGFLDVEALYADAQSAFAALETLLLQGISASKTDADETKTGGPTSAPFFSSSDDDDDDDEEEAGLFDAEVFAYTNIILDQALCWNDTRLADLLRRFPGLVAHRERMLATYFGVA